MIEVLAGIQIGNDNQRVTGLNVPGFRRIDISIRRAARLSGVVIMPLIGK
jgi:hypothetical protein